jgi:hypothetical protein
MNRKENFTKQITESCISKAVSIFLEEPCLMMKRYRGAYKQHTKTLNRHGLIAGAPASENKTIQVLLYQLSAFRITVLMILHTKGISAASVKREKETTYYRTVCQH